MSIDLTMPRLSDTMESGTIIKWNVKEGDEVSAGDVVADIETDKATMEMQVYDDGTVAKILVDEGKTVDVGTTIAILAEEDEDPGDISGESASAGEAEQEADREEGEDEDTGEESAEAAQDDDEQDEEEGDDKAEDREGDERKQRDSAESPKGGGKRDSARAERGAGGQAPSGGAATKANGRIRISPVARRLADEHGLDINRLKGSGPSGRIVKKDVLAAVEQGAGAEAHAAPAGGEAAPLPAADAGLEAKKVPLSNMRQTIAKRLVESKTTIPHYQVTVRFNMDPLLELRTSLNEQLAAQNVKLSVNDFIVRACALAIHQHPEFNASWAEDSVQIHSNVNIGVAISLPAERGGGLVVGTLRDTDRTGLREISARTQALAEKARSKGLTLEEMSEATFTVSNLGMYGVDHFTAIINPPNTAILAVGAALERPVVRNGQLTIGHEMSATLSLDHRVIDGAMAARYLQTLKQLIESPATLLV